MSLALLNHGSGVVTGQKLRSYLLLRIVAEVGVYMFKQLMARVTTTDRVGVGGEVL